MGFVHRLGLRGHVRQAHAKHNINTVLAMIMLTQYTTSTPGLYTKRQDVYHTHLYRARIVSVHGLL